MVSVGDIWFILHVLKVIFGCSLLVTYDMSILHVLKVAFGWSLLVTYDTWCTLHVLKVAFDFGGYSSNNWICMCASERSASASKAEIIR